MIGIMYRVGEPGGDCDVGGNRGCFADEVRGG